MTRIAALSLLLLALACEGAIGEGGAPRSGRCTPTGGPSDAVPCLPGTGPEVDGPVCGAPTIGPSELQRLGAWQIRNALNDVFGEEAVGAADGPLRQLPEEGVEDVFLTFDRFVSSDLQETMIDVGLAIGDAVVGRPDGLLGACEGRACLDAYLDGPAARLFRRPLAESELERARALFEAGEETGLADVIASHLASPHFLIRWELGETRQDDGLLVLTAFELASRLSFGIADTVPDSQLLGLAASGELLDEDVLYREASRLLESERGRRKTTAQIFAWLGLERDIDLSTLPSAFLEGVDVDGLGEAAVAETEAFIEHVVFEARGGFADLLKSRASFASHAGLASIYGHAPADGDPQTMPEHRQGILHRLPFLYAPRTRTNLIERGVVLRRHLFCNTLPTPDFAIINQRDARPLSEEELLRTDHRSVVEHETDEPVCATCHSLINPSGGAFEDFDSLGRFRSTEQTYDREGSAANEVDVRTAGEVPIADGELLEVEDSRDLIDYLAASEEGSACFTLQVYEQSQRRLADQADTCVLDGVLDELRNGEGSVFGALVGFFVNESSSLRRQAEGAEGAVRE